MAGGSTGSQRRNGRRALTTRRDQKRGRAATATPSAATIRARGPASRTATSDTSATSGSPTDAATARSTRPARLTGAADRSKLAASPRRWRARARTPGSSATPATLKRSSTSVATGAAASARLASSKAASRPVRATSARLDADGAPVVDVPPGPEMAVLMAATRSVDGADPPPTAWAELLPARSTAQARKA